MNIKTFIEAERTGKGWSVRIKGNCIYDSPVRGSLVKPLKAFEIVSGANSKDEAISLAAAWLESQKLMVEGLL